MTTKALALPTCALPTSTGLMLAGVTEEEHANIGCFLASVDSASQWWQGDWLNAADPAYGEHEKLCRAAGLNYKTTRNHARVCAAIESARRRAKLTFGHHDVVAVSTLEAEEQDALLDEAEANGWSVGDLRARVQRILLESDDDDDDVPPPVAAPDPPGNGALAAAEQEPVVDPAGNKLPASLHAAFEAIPRFEKMLSYLKSIKTELGALSKTEAGVLLGERGTEIELQRQQLYSSIKFATPYGVCTRCDAHSEKKKTCRACSKSGWMNKDMYRQRKAAEPKAAER